MGCGGPGIKLEAPNLPYPRPAKRGAGTHRFPPMAPIAGNHRGFATSADIMAVIWANSQVRDWSTYAAFSLCSMGQSCSSSEREHPQERLAGRDRWPVVMVETSRPQGRGRVLGALWRPLQIIQRE